MEQQSNLWQRGSNSGPLRSPKSFILSPNAAVFVPKNQQNPALPPQQQSAGGAYFQQSQMDMHQPQSSLVQQRFAAAQGGVEPGGGGGGSYDYQQQQQMGGGPAHHLGSNNGAMANGGSNADACKVSSLQSRLNNMRVSGGGKGDYNHHQHHQQPMQQHHLPQHGRVQQPYHQGGHHGGQHHGHHQQQQQHHPQQAQLQQAYSYGVGYSSNAINNHLNHPILGAAGHHNMGGIGPDNRKHNNGGQQHHRSRQQHQHQHHHHQQHQQQQQHHHQGSHHHHQGGGGDHGPMGGGGGGSNMAPMGGNAGGGGGPHGGDYNDYEQSSDNQSFALDYLTEVIAELYDNPGMFEDVQQKLSTLFADFRNDNYVLSNAIEMIFEQSIKESNFRYMGARLCQLLDSLDSEEESLMRMLLRLKMLHQQSELLNFMKQEQVKVRGTTLFLAELYMQLRSAHHDLGVDIATHIIDAIQILLGKEGPENLKCVCQCLKLCGFELEQDCRDEVHHILGSLEKLQSQSQSSVGKLIKSVLDLQSKSWGRSEEVVSVAPVPTATNAPGMTNPGVMGPAGVVLAMGGAPGGLPEFNDSPVFYGPDGEVLTEEENSFLETNMGNKMFLRNDYDDDDELAIVDGMTQEEVMAFQDFLQSTNNPPNQQQ